MQSVEYRILAYAPSEEVFTGVDLLVVLKLEERVEPRLRAFILERWKTVIAGADDDTIDYLESVIYEVRQYLVIDRCEDVDTLFEGISDMSIGPLRTSASGSCELNRLETLPFAATDQTGEVTPLKRGALGLLIACLHSAASQLQATRT